MSTPRTLRITSWNVNSIRARTQRVFEWLEANTPDVLCLQETKVVDEAFPYAEFEARGYAVETFGQKTYNGVAIATRADLPPTHVQRGLPNDDADAQKRLIAADVAGVRVVNVYVPNGSDLDSPKFPYKLDWLSQLRSMLDTAHRPDQPLVICGDFNIAPEDRDVYDPDAWRGRVLFSDPEHAALARLTDWGLRDAFRLHVEDGGHYTWWDYRNARFQRREGLRIDLFLVTAPLARRCTAVAIDKDERRARKGQPDLKPSDHAPVTATFTLDPD